MLRVVVLGTGTGVGKTRFGQLLVRALRQRSPGAVAGVKPVETGVRRSPGGVPAPGSDAAALERASSGQPPRPHPLYALGDPVSAHLAARREGVAISLDRIRRWATLHYDICIVETAGGAFSPLTARKTNVDLALALEPAVWILVAPDSLGVLHDVRSTWTALAARCRAPDFLALTAAREPDSSTGTNATELARVGLPRPIAVLPRGCRSPAPLAELARILDERRRVTPAADGDRRRGAAAAHPGAPRSRRRGSR